MKETGFWLDENGGLVVRRTQDVEPILEHNKRLATADDGYSPSRDVRRVASIPLAVIEQWRAEGFDLLGQYDPKELRRRLNDPDNRFFRTAPGKL